MGTYRRTRDSFLALVAVLGLLVAAHAQQKWVGSWAASQQPVEPHNSIPAADTADVTLRQIVHLSIGGDQLRLHLSNRYGTVPLTLTDVHIARAVSADSSKIQPDSDQPLTFSGQRRVTIPAAADYLSDAIAYSSSPFADLAITLHTATVPADQTGHPGSRSTSYLVHGDRVTDNELPNATKMDHWYFIAGIDFMEPKSSFAVITLGDSITDGHAATTNGNDRWPDVLARRLRTAAPAQAIAVLNHGIGGNRLLTNGLGPNVLARFDHDVLAQAGARYLMVLEGINDIGMFGREGEHTAQEHQAFAGRMIAAYHQVIERAHTNGIRVIGCTVMPFAGSAFYHPGPLEEGDRQVVNRWIRAPGNFDGVIDFDELTRDPANPDRLLPQFDSGDHLHPSPAGYAAMGNAIPVTIFAAEENPAQSKPPVQQQNRAKTKKS
jgi:lysophospholipase L1-like esterase